MKTILLVFLLSSPCFSAGSKYTQKDPLLQDEIDNIYKNMSQPPQFVDFYALTKVQILSSTPKRIGRPYFCTDCTTDAVCVSTGTTPGAFSRMTARTTACQ